MITASTDVLLLNKQAFSETASEKLISFNLVTNSWFTIE